MSMSGSELPVPALFTSTPRPPSSSARSSTTAAARSGSVRSWRRTAAALPSSRTCPAVSSAPSLSEWNVIPTSNPCSASITAVALPMPESAPVMIATRSYPSVMTLPWSVAGSCRAPAPVARLARRAAALRPPARDEPLHPSAPSILLPGGCQVAARWMPADPDTVGGMPPITHGAVVQRANSVARDSRTTVMRIWPG